MSEAGLKFHCNWIQEKPISNNLLKELNAWRDKLYESGLIGVYDNGIGYGNISIRHEQTHFIITGTATGQYKKLSPKHYTKVTEYDLIKNSLTSVGPIKASSESLTHAVIYDYDKNINAVIHVHHLGLWRKLMNKVPTTDTSVEYGTTAMANEIIRLFKETHLSQKKILVMAGHEEGIVCFGKNLNEAGSVILEKLKLL
jgi:ribulose-5-phosphate 4-epimerase/fuculose-1-phosphate aldolase